MGGGDIKFMAAAGFVIGWKASVIALFVGAVCGVVFSVARKIKSGSEMKGVVPFGPFLSVGVAFAAFLGEKLFNMYLDMFI